MPRSAPPPTRSSQAAKKAKTELGALALDESRYVALLTKLVGEAESLADAVKLEAQRTAQVAKDAQAQSPRSSRPSS